MTSKMTAMLCRKLRTTTCAHRSRACRMEKAFMYAVFLIVVACIVPSYGKSCGANMTETTGTIVTPGYPRNYSRNLHCSWTIKPPQSQGLVVELTIEEFELEDSKSCRNDYIMVYDGPTVDSPILLPSSCGSSILWPVYPSKLLSTGTTMTISFVSNGAISAGGFRATFKQVTPREEFMLAVDLTFKQIHKLDRLGIGAQVLPIVGLRNPVAVDYDPIDRKVYFSDVGSKFIARINTDGTDQEFLAFSSIKVPDGLAVDYVARILYWTDTGTDTISVSRLDGKLRRILLDTDLDEPRAIVVHQNQGYVYFADWGSFPKIEKCKGDGSDRTAIVTGGLGLPNGLALDGEGSKLYWADALVDRIERSNLDGSKRQFVKVLAADVHPFGLVVLDSGIFWTDWKTNGIVAADSAFKEEPVTFVINGQPRRLHGLAHHTSSAPSLPEKDCSYGRLNSGCKELCVLTPTGSACLAALPFFENCPRDVVVWKNVATVVTWEKPSVRSPSGVGVTVRSSHGTANSITLSPDDDIVQITYFALDVFGNEANCSLSISVVYDNVPPTVTACPEDIFKEKPSLQNDIAVYWQEPKAFDNSGNVTLVRQTYSSGSRFNLGESEVVYLWQDGQGNTAECKFQITITSEAVSKPWPTGGELTKTLLIVISVTALVLILMAVFH